MTSRGIGNSRPYEKFVRGYMAGYDAGETADQIAKRCETTKGALFVHAAFLRKHGVRLPKLADRLDASFLNRIISGTKKRRADAQQTA